MREVERALGHLAHANVNMVIHGEPGTGKRVLAERIHQQGPRSGEPFVALRSRSFPAEVGASFDEDGASCRARRA
jgi:two-component system nitrogen regulation response regulator GlnG